jgi:hypothetical protein
LDKRTRHLAPLGALGVIGLALFWPVPFADVTIAHGDILQQFYPWTEFWTSQLKSNGFPLWNPYTYGGSPFLGNLQIAPWYLPGTLLAILSPLRWFGWTMLLHTVLAGVFMYFLIFHLTRDRLSSTAMGLVYLGSGFLVTRISDGHITILNGLPYIPLILLSFLRWHERPAYPGWVLLTIFISIQLLGGQPQIPYLTLFLAGLMALRFSWERYRGGERSLLPLLLPEAALLTAAGGAILLTAPAWLPFYELNQLSAIRSSGISFESAAKDSLPWVHLWTFFAPFLFGDPAGSGFWETSTGYHEICGYMGIGTVLFALAALFAPRWPRKWFWVGAALGMLLLALGSNFYLYKSLYLFLPGVRFFRVPARFLLLYSVCLCILGGYGLNFWLWDRDKQPALRLKILLAIAAMVLIVLLGRQYAMGLSDGMPKGDSFNEAMMERQSGIRGAVATGVGFLLWWTLAIMASRLKKVPVNVYGVCLVILLGVETIWFAHRFIDPRPTSEILAGNYPETPVIEYLKSHTGGQRVLLPDATLGWQYRKEHPELFPNRLMVHGLRTVRGYDQTFLESYAAYIYGMQGIEDDRYLNVFLNVFDPARIHPRLLSALAVRYVVTPEPIASKDFRKVLSGSPMVYEYTKAFPRAYILPPDLSIPDRLPEDATAIIELDTPNRIAIRAELARPGWLVLADNDYPGWVAKSGSDLVRIEKVLGTFRGIRLEAGRHEVVMDFRPSSLKQGLALSLFTFIALVGAWAVVKFGKRRSVARGKAGLP